jgi:hypothetical protein
MVHYPMDFKAQSEILNCDMNTPPAKAGGFGLRLKSGSTGYSAD